MVDESLVELLDTLTDLPDEQINEVVESMPAYVVDALLAEGVPVSAGDSHDLPDTPLDQALELDPKYRDRSHLRYLSDRLAAAVRRAEQGESSMLLVSMPPRSGKSKLTSVHFLTWLMRVHPEWKIGLVSYSDTLTVGWGREIRQILTDREKEFGKIIAPDGGAMSHWNNLAGGSFIARSAPGQSVTGLGFNVLLIDDAVRDFAAAHSSTARDNLWKWWVANAVTRLEPPYIVVALGTRWHEDDLLGRLLSKDYPGDPDDWEVISFPALAEKNDVLGRSPGEPLISPLFPETNEQALQRWKEIRTAVGSYSWAALYQQHPAPAQGAVFNSNWWRYWTTDPAKATDDGRVMYLQPEKDLAGARWLDSWDAAFDKTETSSFVVGQRWAKRGEDRFLIAQARDRWDFPETIEQMESWALRDNPFLSPCGRFVHERLVEAKANGPAIIASLRKKISGIKPILPKGSKEARARAISPEVESGHVYLPHPTDPGNQWVTDDLLPELRDFPFAAHDDQVDSMTQALDHLRDSRRGSVQVPGGQPDRPRGGAADRRVVRDLPRAVASERRRGSVAGVRVPGR